jgi:hypothetical protein
MTDQHTPKLIPPHGGYQNLQSYQMAEIVHDATVVFCNRFISRFSCTNDQMVQAARSGKQNIAEGCMASGTSKKFELKLIGVARGQHGRTSGGLSGLSEAAQSVSLGDWKIKGVILLV